MKKTIGFGVLLIIFQMMGCAYFNTFYNAKHYFKRAYHETRKNPLGKTTAAEKTNYHKAIEKANKLIDMYPKSKYVDDALLLMGKSYYHIEEYLNAHRRLTQLKTSHPKSELIREADLWLAKTDLALERFDEAKEQFESLLNSDVSEKILAEVHFFLGRFYQQQNAFEEAVQAFQESDNIGLEDRKAMTMYAIASNYDSLGMYDEAADYYHRVLNADPTQEIRYEAELKYAQMQKKQKRFDEAVRLFEKLLGEEVYKAHIPELRLEIADCLMRKGDMKDAILAYRDIAQEHKRSKHSAKAYYMLGKIHEEYQNDYNRALDAFTQVQHENRQSEVSDSAETKKRDIQRLMALKRVVEMVQTGEEGEVVIVKEETQEDSLTDNLLYAMIDSADVDTLRQRLLLRLAGQIFVDSVLSDRSSSSYYERGQDGNRDRRSTYTPNRSAEEETIRVDWKKWIEDGEIHRDLELTAELRKLDNRRKKLEKKRMSENPDFKSFNPEELDRNLFLLAELYLFRFNMPDSAIKQYNRIVEEFPKSTYAPRALYNLSYIEGTIRENMEEEHRYLQRLVEKYPQSLPSKAAGKQLGLSVMQVEEDSAVVLFQDAENTLFEYQNSTEAIRKYEEIWEKYPDSDLAPKAAYSMAWISEYRLDSLDLAFMLYDSLLKCYPETDFAKKVKNKVATYKMEKEKEKQQRLKETTTQITATDTLAGIAPEPETVEDVTAEAPVADTLVAAETEVTTEDPSEKTERDVILDEQIKDTKPKESAQELSDDAVPETDPDEQEVDEPASLIGELEYIRERINELGEIVAESQVNVVSVRVQVDENGKVKSVEINTPTGNLALDGAFREIIRSAEYMPAKKDGVSVTSWITLTIPLREE